MEHKKVCVCCPESAQRVVATMFDVSILRSPSFELLLWSGFFTMAGLYTPYIFLPDLCRQHGVAKGYIDFLVPTIGVARAFGSIATVAMTRKKNCTATCISIVSFFASGVAVLLMSFSHHKYFISIECAMFGFFIGR